MQKQKSRRGLAHRILVSVVLLALLLIPAPVAAYWNLQQAQQYEKQGNFPGAARAYAAAAQYIPRQPDLWEKAGHAAWLAGDAENAVNYLSRAAERDALSQQGWIDLGEAYQALGETGSAESVSGQAPSFLQAYQTLAQVHRQQGDFAAAIQDWTVILDRQPGDANAHYQLGLLLAAADPQTALPELMQAAELDPELAAQVESLRAALNAASLSNDRAHQFLLAGRALGTLSEWDLAAETFRNAIALSADYAEAWAWLGEANQQQGLDGRIEIEKALALDPGSAMIQGLYGFALQRQGQSAEALAAFQKAAALEPEAAVWEMALGSGHEQTGDLVAALEHYRRATELSPADVLAWQALADFSLRNSVDPSGVALPAAQRLMELASKDWQSYDIAGQVYLKIDDAARAEELLKKAAQLAPQQAAPVLHLGLLYLQTGNSNQALAVLTQAKALDPDGTYGHQAERLLEQYFP